MSTAASQSAQSVISELGARHLELAPKGWRECVEKIAEGYADVVGGHAYCLNCDRILMGAQGHDINCVTMVARRMLANEAFLHAYLAPGPLDGRSSGHRAEQSGKPGRRSIRSYGKPRARSGRPDMQYVAPTFLDAARPVRES